MPIYLLFLLLPFWLIGGESLLKNNLSKAKVGDYAVIAQGKSYTLFHILSTQNQLLTVEEVTIPSSIASGIVRSWRSWLENKAPQNTSWVQYQINLQNDEINNYYSFTKNGYFTVPEADNFLATLLKLNLTQVPYEEMRKVGRLRKVWQPKMVINGEIQENVFFAAYSTRWPKDGGPLSGKLIEIYLPHSEGDYPSYFPYWLQAKGVIGPATVRVIDSGKL